MNGFLSVPHIILVLATVTVVKMNLFTHNYANINLYFTLSKLFLKTTAQDLCRLAYTGVWRYLFRETELTPSIYLSML